MQSMFKVLHTQMTEQEYLKHCLNEIEKKLGWKKSSTWKESDYIKLSEIISEDSNISISSHTLKRLFGKIKYNKHYNPQQATKDALSKFLNYSNWDNFIEKNTHKVNDFKEDDAHLNNVYKISKRTVGYSFVVVLLILLVIFSIRGYEKYANNTVANFMFKLKDSIGEVPFTVPVEYEVNSVKSDSIFIDFNFIHPYSGNQIVGLNKDGNVHNFTYQIPGYYEVNLIKENEIIASKNVLALSKGWDSYLVYESKTQEFWLNNEIRYSKHSNDNLYFSKDSLKAEGFDVNPVIYVAHRLFKQFEIDGDNFEFESRFKNSKELGGISCYDYILRLICENSKNHLLLMEDGCSQFSGLKFGEMKVDGTLENLSDFKFDLNDWNVLLISVKQKNIEVFINNKLIYEGKYQIPNGKLVGIENVLKGTGMVDYIKIKDQNHQTVFFDDFD